MQVAVVVADFKQLRLAPVVSVAVATQHQHLRPLLAVQEP
jgi:hypothetical protein